MKRIETKNSRVRRELAKREPQVVEPTKQALLLKGPKCSLVASKAIRDLTLLKKPDAKLFQKRNLTRPFEDQTSVEFLCQANDTALFGYASTSKKRPHNLVLGRVFDGAVLDMVEFGIEEQTFKTMKAFTSAGNRKASVSSGSKAAFVFQGEEWTNNTDMGIIRNLFTDFFRGDDMDLINLASLDRVIICTAPGAGKILFRHYAVALKKSGTKIPRVELEEVGPRIDLSFRRRKSATDDVRKQAMRVAQGDAKRPEKHKNIERNARGDTTGRIHMKHQNFNEISQFKGLRALKKGKRKADAIAAAGGSDPTAAQDGDSDVQARAAAAEAATAAGPDVKPKKKERLKGQARWSASKKQKR